jgi:hypothetical protein
MALTAGNIGFTGYQQPDYSGVVEASGLPMQAIGQGITQATDYFKDMKNKEGQVNAFGKSMDAMAKAFPDQAEIFSGAKMDVLDPNASLIDRVARMNEFQNTLKMAQAQQMLNAQAQYYGARTSAAQAGAGASAASSTTATDSVFGPQN